jgi:hypothetical protein
MAVTVPTPTDAQALFDFIMERVDEEFEAAQARLETLDDDDTAGIEDHARFIRVSNSNKLALHGTAEALGGYFAQGDSEEVERAWHLLTSAGEQWRDHPGHQAVWENPQMASVRLALGV